MTNSSGSTVSGVGCRLTAMIADIIVARYGGPEKHSGAMYID
jgi:hypothetical protein